MPCIKIQKLIFNDDGSIHSGSASILVSSYDKSIKGHSRKTVREKLGRILYINEGHTCGIFLSPTRGLVEYDAEKDEFAIVGSGDPRLPGLGVFPAPPVHTVFGDAYLVLGFAENCGMPSPIPWIMRRSSATSCTRYAKMGRRYPATISLPGQWHPASCATSLSGAWEPTPPTSWQWGRTGQSLPFSARS